MNTEIKIRSLLNAKQNITNKGDLNNRRTKRRLEKIESQINELQKHS